MLLSSVVAPWGNVFVQQYHKNTYWQSSKCGLCIYFWIKHYRETRAKLELRFVYLRSLLFVFSALDSISMFEDLKDVKG